MRARRGGTVLLAAVTMLTIGACGDDDPTAEETAPAATTPSPTTAEPIPASSPTPTQVEPDDDPTSEARILAGYDEAMQSNIASYDPPDPDHPDLLATHGAPALAAIQAELGDLQAAGHSEVVTYRGNPTVVSVDGGGALISDHYTATILTVDTSSGEELETEDVKRIVETKLSLRDGTWVIVDRDLIEESHP